ncbi:MAG TPA: retroviral-like aspartic protease family protein [Acidiphilium sp.]|nr:retroviral-like aspartic protease family protein [Acidiphilium sp.]HQU22952.1 retroviral-like aspartic protease family protein [Acidiphilium sp.]
MHALRCLFGVSLGLALAGCAAQSTCPPKPVALLTISFRHGEPVFPARINGQPATMLFDTGAIISSVSPAGVKQFHLPVVFDRRLTLNGVGGSAHNATAQVKTLAFGGAIAGGLRMPIVRAPVNSDPDQSAVSGAIGNDILAHYDEDIDFPADQVFLLKTGYCSTLKPWSGPAATVHFELARGNSAIEFAMQINGHPVTALLDTGATNTVLSPGTFARISRHGPRPHRLGTHFTTGIGAHHAKVTAYRLQRLSIGGVRLKHPVVTVLNHAVLPFGLVILGENFIRRHELFIDHQTNTLYIHP